MLTHDNRSALREFNRVRMAEEKVYVSSFQRSQTVNSVKLGIKQYKKDHKNVSKSDLRSYEVMVIGINSALLPLTWEGDWEAKQALKLDEFNRQQAQQRDEEETMLRMHHENQMEKFLLSLGLVRFGNLLTSS